MLPTLAAMDVPHRVRNIGADVAVGDWVLAVADDERSNTCCRDAARSCAVRRSPAAKATAHTLAANVDMVGSVARAHVAAEPTSAGA